MNSISSIRCRGIRSSSSVRGSALTGSLAIGARTRYKELACSMDWGWWWWERPEVNASGLFFSVALVSQLVQQLLQLDHGALRTAQLHIVQ